MKTIIQILKGSDIEIKENIKALAAEYLSLTGLTVCLTCPASINLMILKLKHIMKVCRFEFARKKASYKNKKGDKTTISNSTMSDAKAIEFLKENPERISLFSKFPENWETLLLKGIEEETEEELETRLAIEAEQAAAKEGEGNIETPSETEDLTPEQEAEAAAEAAVSFEKKVLVNEKSYSKEDLLKLKLADLRKMFTEVRATSLKEFVEKVFAE